MRRVCAFFAEPNHRPDLPLNRSHQVPGTFEFPDPYAIARVPWTSALLFSGQAHL